MMSGIVQVSRTPAWRGHPRAPTAGVREAPRHEIVLSGQRRLQQALWGFGRSRRRWDGAVGEQDWVAATGSRALEDSWTSGKGVEALAGGCCEPRVRGNGTHRVVAGR